MTRVPERAPITVLASLPRFTRIARRVRKTITASLPRLTKRPVALEVFLISDPEMRRLNRRTRGNNRPTNVLSFEERGEVPHPELPKNVEAKGEIYLAPDHIARRGEYVEPLALHGLLHLFGYTHGNARDRMKMERKEKKLMKLVIGKR